MMTVLMVLLSACNLLSEVDTGKLELLNKANQEVVFLPAGGEKIIVLVTSSDWAAQSDADWCKVSPSEGTSDAAKLKLKIEANPDVEERNATVTVSTDQASLQISVTQRGKKAVLLEDADYVIEAEGGIFEVELEHNVEYEVEIPGKVSWIREVKSKKMSKAVHEFEVQANESEDERSAEISFVAEDDDIEEVVTVVQKGKKQVADEKEEEGEKPSLVFVMESLSDFLQSPGISPVPCIGVTAQLQFSATMPKNMNMPILKNDG